jgi:glycosyltransferase involved in cell wall biosynthesis
MKSNLLAIIIPYYKFTFFEATLQSLANQTDKRFKVYIGDDSSPEDPTRLVENYKEEFNLVYHRFDNNLGGTSLTQQWERCISLINEEEWVMILGDDDVLGPNVVVAFYENLEEIIKRGMNVIRYSTCKIDEKDKMTSVIYKHSKIEKAGDFLFRKTRSSLSEYIVRKSQVLGIGFKNFPLAWYSDVMAVLEFSDFKAIFSINEAVVYVRISGLSISGSHLNKRLKLRAKFDFYYCLLNDKIDCFTVLEQEELWNRLNKYYYNDKKNHKVLLKVSKLYLAKKLYKEYFLFILKAISTYNTRS